MRKLSPYELGFYEAGEGFRFRANPFSWEDEHDNWMAWVRGWMEYKRNN